MLYKLDINGDYKDFTGRDIYIYINLYKDLILDCYELKHLDDAWSKWPELAGPNDGQMMDSNHVTISRGWEAMSKAGSKQVPQRDAW